MPLFFCICRKQVFSDLVVLTKAHSLFFEQNLKKKIKKHQLNIVIPEDIKIPYFVYAEKPTWCSGKATRMKM